MSKLKLSGNNSEDVQVKEETDDLHMSVNISGGYYRMLFKSDIAADYDGDIKPPEGYVETAREMTEEKRELDERIKNFTPGDFVLHDNSNNENLSIDHMIQGLPEVDPRPWMEYMNNRANKEDKSNEEVSEQTSQQIQRQSECGDND